MARRNGALPSERAGARAKSAATGNPAVTLRSTLQRLWNIGHIGMTPPRPDADRRGVAIVMIVRDEATHIGEWADFHARAGARAVLVYDNGCTDATLPILRDRLGARLTVVPWRQLLTDGMLRREIHNQALAYAHAASNFGGAFRWMAFIDADEFLVPKRARDLDGALAHLGGAANISLPWHMFGRSGHMTPPEGGILRNYLMRAADPMSDAPGLRQFKCIVDPCRLTTVGVHSFATRSSTRTANDRGHEVGLRDRDRRAFYSADHVQLNHYYARSQAELEAKIGRGPNLASKAPEYRRKVLRTVASIERDEVEDRAALEFLARLDQM